MVLDIGVKSSIKSKDVLSTHYSGPSYIIESTDELITGIGKYAGVSILSHSGRPAPTQGFVNPSSVQKWGGEKGGLVEYSITPFFVIDQKGNLSYIMRSSSNEWLIPIVDLEAGGVTFNPVEDMYSPHDRKQDRFGRWKETTEQSNAIDVVESNPEIGLSQSPEFIPEYSKHDPSMTDIDVPITHHHGTIPINKFGEYISRIANLKADLRDVMQKNYFFEGVGPNPETEALLESLIAKGLGPPRNIAGIGVENFEEEGIAAATYPTNGAAYLVASKNINEQAVRVTEALGMTGKDAVKYVKRFILLHELHHVYDRRKGVSKTAKEIDVGEFLAEFFGERAPQLEGKIAKYYEALARENIGYAQGWREGRIKPSAKSFRAKIANLVLKYDSEARDKDLEGEEARDYVASRLEKDIEELGESEGSETEHYSVKDSKYDNSDETVESDVEDSENENSDADVDGAEESGPDSDGTEGNGGDPGD